MNEGPFQQAAKERRCFSYGQYQPDQASQPFPSLIGEQVDSKSKDTDSVNKPAHYTAGKVECIDAIEAALGPDGSNAFLRGQVLKYVWRMELKTNPLEDAKKAEWYLKRLIGRLG